MRLNKNKRKGSNAYFIPSSLPDLRCYPIPGSRDLSPKAGLAVLTHPNVCPALRPRLYLYLLVRPVHPDDGDMTVWLRGPGWSHQVSRSVGLGSPAEASFLRGQPPRHLSMRPRYAWFWRGEVKFQGEEIVRHKPLGVCSAHSALIHSPGSHLSRTLWFQVEAKMHMKKCCRPVDISCNYNFSTCAYGASKSQGLRGCQWQLPSENDMG